MTPERKREIEDHLLTYAKLTPFIIVALIGVRFLTPAEARIFIQRIFIDKNWPPDDPASGGGGLGFGSGPTEGTSEFAMAVDSAIILVFVSAIVALGIRACLQASRRTTEAHI